MIGSWISDGQGEATDEVLRLARLSVGGDHGSWVILRGSAALEGVATMPRECRHFELREVVDGKRGLAVVVGAPLKLWLEQIIAKHDRQAIGSDASGEMWLLEATRPDQRLGSLAPEEIATVFECLVDADSLTFELPPEAMSFAFVRAQHTR